jgi:hypothetical protein
MREVLQDSRPEEVVEFMQDARVDPDRAGGPRRRARRLDRARTRPLGWCAILEGLSTTGEIPFDGLPLLRQADAEAFDLLVDGDATRAPVPESGMIPRLAESLARMPVDA